MDQNDLLQHYVTNTDKQVFAITDLQGMVGAVMARYSRAETGLRETLSREFIKEDKLKLSKAGKLIERVLIAYGDDSVGELEGAHLSMENISMLATKVIEHRRIGGSPIEQSTRYVRYDFKDEVKGYHYFTPTSFDEKDRTFYRKHMDAIFDAYAQMWSPLVAWLKQQKPIEEAEYDLKEKGSTFAEMQNPKHEASFRKTWENDIKTKACDVLRAFLPLATRANVGLFGNGRFYQHLISKLYTSDLAEANDLGRQAFEELSKVIPHYVKRARKMEYLQTNDQAMQQLVKDLFGEIEESDAPRTRLVEPDHDYILSLMNNQPELLSDAYRDEQELNFLTAMVYPYVRAPFLTIRKAIKALPASDQEAIRDAYYGERATRRDRPERAIEYGYPYTFDIVTEWAVYKDLMRHRMGTIMIQPMRPDLGFMMPDELAKAGLEAVAEKALATANALFAWLEAHHPTEKEYAILQGHKVRWFLGMNDRALMHMLELRTAPQGHPNYRKCSQELYQLAHARFPKRIERMKFVNHEEIYWSRGDSEARQRVKEDELDSAGT